MGIEDFQTVFKIGEGSYSKVYKVLRTADQKTYAMKKVPMKNISESERENALNEVRILASVNCPFIVAYREAFLDRDSLYIVMDYVEEGDLKKILKNKAARHEQFDEALAWRLLYEMAVALKALHSKKVIHCDMKSANIFVTQE
jgi:NIMA (never in mitosis gene a)-related kinase